MCVHPPPRAAVLCGAGFASQRINSLREGGYNISVLDVWCTHALQALKKRLEREIEVAMWHRAGPLPHQHQLGTVTQ